MQTIHLLPEKLITLIAAGEVIERPAFAVKELIENSIDANADYIKIEIEQGGLKKIVVTDNGDGMSREDLQECFKHHTTSKVNIDETSLIGIKSLGFRGEALSSICSIADVSIQTRREGELGGLKIAIKPKEKSLISPIGIPKGTTVKISNIFYAIPARKKFLKDSSSEGRLINEIVSTFALSFPNIHFILMNNGKTVLDLPKVKEISERTRKILGSTIFSNLIPLTFEDSYINISGFISKPQAASYYAKQFLFVNNRWVIDKMITLSVKESYGNLIDGRSQPVFVLFINMPYETIDPNVHPRKEQISFLNPRLVFDCVQKAVLKSLSENNLTFVEKNRDHIDPKSETGRFLKSSTDFFKIYDPQITNLSNIQQIHNLYLLTPTKNGLLYIDQHAAHERVLYEQFLKEFKNQSYKKAIFTPKKSIIIDLPFTDFELIKNNLRFFKEIGFDLEEFPQNTIKLNSFPMIYKDHNIEELILELTKNLQNEITKDLDTQTDKLLKYLACRTAIKRGDKISKKQSQLLVKKLEQTENNITCPHGRPTKVEIILSDINKMFKR